MNIHVTNELFLQTYFAFYDKNIIEKFNKISNILGVADIWEEPFNNRVCISERLMDMLNDYSWSEADNIVFVTDGIDLGNYEIKNRNSYYDGRENRDSVFDAGITLTDINEWIVRDNDLGIDDIIILAKNRWCLDMGLKYNLEYKANRIEKKISISEKDNNINLLDSSCKDELYREYINYLRSMDYRKEYLKSEHWKHFRKEALKFYNYECTLCKKKGGNGRGLNVHHNNYKNIGRETFNDIVVICNECHKRHHGK